MIACLTNDLKDSDKERIRKWLIMPEAEMFLSALKSDEAQLKCQALHEIDKASIDVSRGGPVPTMAQVHLRKAATLSSVIKTIEDKMSDKSKLTQSKLIIE